ncbi:hypothetical protein MyNCGM683_06570 [Achromobacter xylosoxidans]
MDGVDTLFSRALLPGRDGRVAADQLFDQYTGADASGKPGQGETLSRAVLELICRLEDRTPERGHVTECLALPPKLLIMAGFASEPESDDRQRLSQQLSACLSRDYGPLLYECLLENTDAAGALLEEDRMVTAGELDACLDGLNRASDSVHFAPAREGSQSTALLPDLAPDVAKGIYAQPICIREHWVLFGVDTRAGENSRAFLFDSLDYLNQRERESLLDLAKTRLGASSLPLDHQAEKLQGNAQNGCGVFVAEAMRVLAEADPARTPIESLRKYAAGFLALDAHEQRAVVNRCRARLYGEVLDSDFFIPPSRREIPNGGAPWFVQADDGVDAEGETRIMFEVDPDAEKFDFVVHSPREPRSSAELLRILREPIEFDFDADDGPPASNIEQQGPATMSLVKAP